jgi:hypothetical protein
MSWVCLPEREEACLPAGCLAGGPFALWKSNLTASECSRSASETDTSSPSRSGMTSAPLTARRGEAPLTSSPEGSLVRTSPAQGEAQGLAAIAQASGLKCSELLARYGLRGSLPKTARCFALEDLPSCSKGLPAWGMMLAGACSELMTSVRRTNANASGLWPTPTTIGNELAPFDAEARRPSSANCGSDASDADRSELRQQPGRSCGQGWQSAAQPGEDSAGAGALADARSAGAPISRPCGLRTKLAQLGSEGSGVGPRYWDALPDLAGMDDGVANRLERIKATGNGQVPAVAALAFRVLSEVLTCQR